jgi:glycosyltransferase involved in cell wall biosynthesis
MTSSKPRLHVVYEYGIDSRPHSSPFIRLIRPFTYPRVQAHLDVSLDLRYEGQPADLVIVDRLWRPDVSLELVGDLVKTVRDSGARLVYNLDDNFFDLVLENKGWPPPEFLPIVEYLLHMAHGVIVSTPALRERLLEYNQNILVLENQLDERLLVGRSPVDPATAHSGGERIVIGYMGTFTHDEDFLMILPALQAVHRRHPGKIELQLVGALRSEATRQAIGDLPTRSIYPRPEEHEYPLFMIWFTSQVHWDIAISPLRDTLFTRCKSDIKFLDYAAIGAAGIFSQSPAYASLQHRHNAWLAENTADAWEEALETLIADADLRQCIAREATRTLYTNRTLAQRSPDWVTVVEKLLS